MKTLRSLATRFLSFVHNVLSTLLLDIRNWVEHFAPLYCNAGLFALLLQLGLQTSYFPWVLLDLGQTNATDLPNQWFDV